MIWLWFWWYCWWSWKPWSDPGVWGWWFDVGGQEEELPDLDCDQCCNTSTPAGIFKMHMLVKMVLYTWYMGFYLWKIIQYIHSGWYFQNTHAHATHPLQMVLSKGTSLTPWEKTLYFCCMAIFTCIKSNYICLIFLRCVFLNVSSKNLGQSK